MSFDPSWDEKDEFPDDNPAFTQQTSNMSGWGEDDHDDPSSPGGWDDLQDEDHMTQLEELIPKDIKQRVLDDISELKQITRFDVANANFGGGTRIILRAGIPVTHLGLDIEQARAWTLDPSKTIVMELSFPPHYFNILAHSEIKVHVGQAASVNGDLHGFRLSWTLMDKIKRFLATLPNTLTPRPYLLSDVHHVMETSSCSYEIAVNALLQTKGNRDSAVLHISNGLVRTSSTGKQQKQEEKSVMARVKTPTKPTKEEQQLMTTFHVSQAAAKFALNLEPKVDDAALLLSDTTSRAEIEHMAAQADQTQSESDRKSRLSPASAVTSLFNLFTDRKQKSKSTSTSTYKDRIADKPLTTLFEQHNYLVRVMLHLEAAIMTCNRSCMLCGQAVEFPGMKPTICGRDLCKMGQDDMGLGFSLEGEIISHPDLVDLFISLTVAAVQANKMHYVTPVGVRATVKGREELSFLAGDGKNLDYAKVMSTLNHVPSVADMRKLIQQGTLIETFNKKDPLIIPLLRWIMTSVRAHLRKLDPSEQMQSMKTPHQYILLCTTPENEAQFQIEKRECERKKGAGNGSIYTFHGSSTGNWHSILRTGLKNMSNTKYMEHGAAHGPGIYMAADSGTSLGYCRQQSGWDKSALGSSIICLALCEVVNDVKPPTPFYVVEKESLVATRYLFLYPSGGCPTMNAQDVGKEAPPLMTGQIGV